MSLQKVLAFGFAIRFIVPTIVPSLPNTVSSVEVVTPLTSFKSLQEAFYYLQHGINLYDGGVNHHTPLLVVLLNFFNELPKSYIVFNLIYALVDVWITKRLVELNQWYYKQTLARKGSLASTPFSDHLIASFYLFNPLIILTNWSHSTLVFTNVLLIESIYQIAKLKSLPRGMILLALASYLNYTPIFMIIPLVSLALTVTHGDKGKVAEAIGIFISAIGLLILCSFAMTSSWQFVDSCWVSIIRFDKISPNVGLWWYFFTEMFVFFNPFFTGVFNLYSVIFILPITIRFSERTPEPTSREADEKDTKVNVGDSFLACILCYTWLVFTKSYPSLGDLALVLSILPIFRSSFLSRCKFGGITAMFMLGCLLLSPIFYYCWIVLGNGNSNFFYSINLTWGGVHGLVLMDLIWGKVTYDYFNENKVSKEVENKARLVQL